MNLNSAYFVNPSEYLWSYVYVADISNTLL